ncbi:MAG: hypothetical protein J2P31_17940 [Blastocatellia bacterium]|nr:hypothetical protein [Blastocatellia bacterium]
MQNNLNWQRSSNHLHASLIIGLPKISEMDPLSASAGILGIALMAIDSCNSLMRVYEELRELHRTTKDLKSELEKLHRMTQIGTIYALDVEIDGGLSALCDREYISLSTIDIPPGQDLPPTTPDGPVSAQESRGMGAAPLWSRERWSIKIDESTKRRCGTNINAELGELGEYLAPLHQHQQAVIQRSPRNYDVLALPTLTMPWTYRRRPSHFRRQLMQICPDLVGVQYDDKQQLRGKAKLALSSLDREPHLASKDNGAVGPNKWKCCKCDYGGMLTYLGVELARIDQKLRTKRKAADTQNCRTILDESRVGELAHALSSSIKNFAVKRHGYTQG